VPELARVEEFRQNLPATMERVTQLVVDNPGQFALLVAGDIVLTRVVMNLVRPRTAAEGLAVMVVLAAGLPLLAGHAVSRGWLRFRVRDEDGNLVPLEP
jgi:hypothetical protein